LRPEASPTGLVLAGGLGLGAYQAGAFAVLEESGRLDLQAVVGSSMGAINGAVIAGSEPKRRVEQLLAFWRSLETDFAPLAWLDPFGAQSFSPVRHARNWLNVLGAHALGVRGVFEPRLPAAAAFGRPSLYDTRPLLGRFTRYIDFDRLNAGPLRYALATTDVQTGETVVCDTAAGDRIGPEHLLASGGLLPSFQPVEIEGRLLADGGLSANAPLEPLLASGLTRPSPPLCIVLDLFAPDGSRPRTLEQSGARANDLKFATQTVVRLEGLRRERALEAELTPTRAGTDLFYLSYRAGHEEAGQEKTYDFSPATLARRMCEGAADAQAALRRLETIPRLGAPGLRIHRIRRS
jgi:NTE family protein